VLGELRPGGVQAVGKDCKGEGIAELDRGAHRNEINFDFDEAADGNTAGR
jgi:hypothetical protein